MEDIYIMDIEELKELLKEMRKSFFSFSLCYYSYTLPHYINVFKLTLHNTTNLHKQQL